MCAALLECSFRGACSFARGTRRQMIARTVEASVNRAPKLANDFRATFAFISDFDFDLQLKSGCDSLSYAPQKQPRMLLVCFAAFVVLKIGLKLSFFCACLNLRFLFSARVRVCRSRELKTGKQKQTFWRRVVQQTRFNRSCVLRSICRRKAERNSRLHRIRIQVKICKVN